MAESWIKIKASLNEMNKRFWDNKFPSEYYHIKYFSGGGRSKGNDDVPIVFEVLIRHNEIGNRSIERGAPYTFETLEKILSEKVKKFEKEENYKKDNDKIKEIESIFAKENNLNPEQNIYRVMNNCAFTLDGIDIRNRRNKEKGDPIEKYPDWATKRNIELIEQWSSLIKGNSEEREKFNNLQKASEIDELYDLDY